MNFWVNIFLRYQKAIDIYEEIARQSLNNNLLKYGVKGHLLNAGLCQLCKGDFVAINNALDRYQVLMLSVSICNSTLLDIGSKDLLLFFILRIWIQHFLELVSANC